MALAAKAKQGLDICIIYARAREKKKKHNPSKGPELKDKKEQRSEFRKTIMLCRDSHVLATHSYSNSKVQEQELKAKFNKLGYQINPKTGEITCIKAHDDLCITS